MFSKHLLNGVRRQKVKRDNQPTPVVKFVLEPYKPDNPSFFIEWDKRCGQYKIVSQESKHGN